jgi:hypothetical protein
MGTVVNTGMREYGEEDRRLVLVFFIVVAREGSRLECNSRRHLHAHLHVSFPVQGSRENMGETYQILTSTVGDDEDGLDAQEGVRGHATRSERADDERERRRRQGSDRSA